MITYEHKGQRVRAVGFDGTLIALHCTPFGRMGTVELLNGQRVTAPVRDIRLLTKKNKRSR